MFMRQHYGLNCGHISRIRLQFSLTYQGMLLLPLSFKFVLDLMNCFVAIMFVIKV